MSARSPTLNSGPATCAEAIDLTSTDYIPTSGLARTLLVRVAGDAKVDMVTFGVGVVLPLVAGYNPVEVTKVYRTGTTATGLVALW